jgi:hypothetical protein
MLPLTLSMSRSLLSAEALAAHIQPKASIRERMVRIIECLLIA